MLYLGYEKKDKSSDIAIRYLEWFYKNWNKETYLYMN